MIFQSPLNYTGGKYKLLPQILPLFPQKINLFVDLFCGGCNVGINVNCKKIIYNDLNKKLIDLYNIFKQIGKNETIKLIEEIIKKYGLSTVSAYGYEYYGCKSTSGVGKYNKAAFTQLRNDFNSLTDCESVTYYIYLYVMIVYAFNNQIRFNSKNQFNLPVGKRDFNKKMEGKLSNFIEIISRQNAVFSSMDFRKFDITVLSSNDFIYLDPPYLITCASYNENGAWSENDERDLLSFMNNLIKNNIRFALSNVLHSKGKVNEILLEWLNINKNKLTIHHLNCDYSNSNYHTKDKISKSDEVLITNY